MSDTVELICPSNSMKQHAAHIFRFEDGTWRCIRPHCKATTIYPSPIELAETHKWLLSYPPGHGIKSYNFRQPRYQETMEVIC